MTVTDLAGRWRSAVVAGARAAAARRVPASVVDRSASAHRSRSPWRSPRAIGWTGWCRSSTELGRRPARAAARRTLDHAVGRRTSGDAAASGCERIVARGVPAEPPRLVRCDIEGPLPALDVLPDCVVAEPGGRPTRTVRRHRSPSDRRAGGRTTSSPSARDHVSLGAEHPACRDRRDRRDRSLRDHLVTDC